MDGNGTVHPRDRLTHVYVERPDLLSALVSAAKGEYKPFGREERMPPYFLLHGFRGTGKSSTLLDLAQALRKDKWIVAVLDYSEVPLGSDTTGDKYWLSVVSKVLERFQLDVVSQLEDPGLREQLVGAREAFLASCNEAHDRGRFIGMQSFKSLFTSPSSPLVMAKSALKASKTALLIDELSALYDVLQANPASSNVLNVHNETLDILRAIKNDKSVDTMAAFGTFSAALLSGGNTSPFNVMSEEGIPLLTKEECREAVVQAGGRLPNAVTDRIWELTRGYPAVFQRIAKHAMAEVSQSLDPVEAWQRYEASGKFINDAVSFKSLERNMMVLRGEGQLPRAARWTLARVFLPSENPVLVDGDTLAHAGFLTAVGALRATGVSNTFEVASPLMRQILIKKVLPVDYRHYIAKPLPRDLSTGYLDGVGMLQILGRVLVKEAYPIGRTKRTGGIGATRLPVPHEVCYQLSLGLFLGQWAGAKASVNHEVTFTHSKDETKGKPDFVVVDLNEGEGLFGTKIVLELSAHLVDGEHGKKDAGGRYPNTVCGHIDKCEDLYSAAKDVVAVYYINFTTQPEANCYKPEAALKDTTLVHVRHDEEGEVLGMLVLRPGETNWVRPRVPTIEDSKSVSVKSLGFEPVP
jgi:hypothetical protein